MSAYLAATSPETPRSMSRTRSASCAAQQEPDPVASLSSSTNRVRGSNPVARSLKHKNQENGICLITNTIENKDK
jgi:hypothetical protein